MSQYSPFVQSLKGVSFLPLLISFEAESLGMGWEKKRGSEADDFRHKIIDMAYSYNLT
jgi:hypothetical protein